MSVFDYVRPVPTWGAEEVRQFLKEAAPETIALLDVRTTPEYRKRHLAGAASVPLAQLHERITELGASKTTIVYCERGTRGRVAAAILARAGYTCVYNMKGGFRAWDGPVAHTALS